jgi:hypothetical protein
MADAVPPDKTAFLVAAVHRVTLNAALVAVTTPAPVKPAAAVWEEAVRVATTASRMVVVAEEPSLAATVATIQIPKSVAVVEDRVPSLPSVYQADVVPRA